MTPQRAENGASAMLDAYSSKNAPGGADTALPPSNEHVPRATRLPCSVSSFACGRISGQRRR